MRELTFIKVPGWYGMWNIEDFVTVEIGERRIKLVTGASGFYPEINLLKGNYIPESIANIKYEEERPPYMFLSEEDFEKYKVELKKIFKVTIIDPLEEKKISRTIENVKTNETKQATITEKFENDVLVVIESAIRNGKFDLRKLLK